MGQETANGCILVVLYTQETYLQQYGRVRLKMGKKQRTCKRREFELNKDK